LGDRRLEDVQEESRQRAAAFGRLRKPNVFSQNDPRNDPIILPASANSYAAFLQSLGRDGPGARAKVKFTSRLILTPIARASFVAVCQELAGRRPGDVGAIVTSLCGNPPAGGATPEQVTEFRFRIAAFASLVASCLSANRRVAGGGLNLLRRIAQSEDFLVHLRPITLGESALSELFTAACAGGGGAEGTAGREVVRARPRDALGDEELAALDEIVRNPATRAGIAIKNFPTYAFAQHGGSEFSACAGEFFSHFDRYSADQKAVEVFIGITRGDPARRLLAKTRAQELFALEIDAVKGNDATRRKQALVRIHSLQRILVEILQEEKQSCGGGRDGAHHVLCRREKTLPDQAKSLCDHIAVGWLRNPAALSSAEVLVFCQALHTRARIFGMGLSHESLALVLYLTANPNYGFTEAGGLLPEGVACPAATLSGYRGGEVTVNSVKSLARLFIKDLRGGNQHAALDILGTAVAAVNPSYRYDVTNGIIVNDETGRPIGRRSAVPPIFARLNIDEADARVVGVSREEPLLIDDCVSVNLETHETFRINPTNRRRQVLVEGWEGPGFAPLSSYVVFRDKNGYHAFHRSDLRLEVFSVQKVDGSWKFFLPDMSRELTCVSARDRAQASDECNLVSFDGQGRPAVLIPLFVDGDLQQMLRQELVEERPVLVEYVGGRATGLRAISEPSFLVKNSFIRPKPCYFSADGGKTIVAKCFSRELFRYDRESHELKVLSGGSDFFSGIMEGSLLEAAKAAARANDPIVPTEEQIEFFCETAPYWNIGGADGATTSVVFTATYAIMAFLSKENADKLSAKSKNSLTKLLAQLAVHFTPDSGPESALSWPNKLLPIATADAAPPGGDEDLTVDLRYGLMRIIFDKRVEDLYGSLEGMLQVALPEEREHVLHAMRTTAMIAKGCGIPARAKQWDQRAESVERQKVARAFAPSPMAVPTEKRYDVPVAFGASLVKSSGAVFGLHGPELLCEERMGEHGVNMAAAGHDALCKLLSVRFPGDAIVVEGLAAEGDAAGRSEVVMAGGAGDLRQRLWQHRKMEQANRVLHASLFWQKIKNFCGTPAFADQLDQAEQSIRGDLRKIQNVQDELNKKIAELTTGLANDSIRQKWGLHQLHRPTLDDVLQIWFQSLERNGGGQLTVNHAKFFADYRRCHDDSLTEPAQVRALIDTIHNLLITKTNYDAARGRMAAFSKFKAFAVAHLEDRTAELAPMQEAFGEFVQTLAAARTYDPTEDLFTLWFEHMTGMRLRPEQTVVLNRIKELLRGRLRMLGNGEIGIIFQLMMGGGKTSVILSQIARIFSDDGKTVVFTNHESQHSSMCAFLKSTQFDRYRQNFYVLNCNINDVRKLDVLQDIHTKLLAAKENKGCLAILSSALRAVIVQRRQSLVTAHKMRKSIVALERATPPDRVALARLREQLEGAEIRFKLCRDITTFISDSCIQVGDECHLNFDPLISVNISEGEKRRFSEEVSRDISTFFSTLAEWRNGNELGREAAQLVRSGRPMLRRHMESLAQEELRRLGMWVEGNDGRAEFSNRARVAFLLSGCDGLEGDAAAGSGFQLDRGAVLSQFADDGENSPRKRFLLCAGQLKTFFLAHEKQFMEHYGFCVRECASGAAEVTVGPYMAANMPSSGQYADPLEKATHSYLAYIELRNSTVPDDHPFCVQVKQLVADLAAGGRQEARDFVQKNYETLLARISDLNAATMDRETAQSELCGALIATRTGDLQAYLELVRTLTRPSLDFFEARWECTSYTQAAMTDCIVDSGTPYNRSIMGLQFADANAQLIDETTPFRILDKEESDLRSGASILFGLSARRLPGQAPVTIADLFADHRAANGRSERLQALIDAAGLFKHLPNREVARQLLVQLDPQIKCSIFYENSRWYALHRDGECVQLPDTSESAVRAVTGLGPDQISVFYDQAHCTGTDFKFSPNMRGICTVGPKTTSSDLDQAILRARLFLATQSIDICVVNGPSTEELPDGPAMADYYMEIAARSKENERKAVDEKKFACYKKEADSALLCCLEDTHLLLQTERERLAHVGFPRRIYARFRMRGLERQCEELTDAIDVLAVTKSPFDLMALYGTERRMCGAQEAYAAHWDHQIARVKAALSPGTYAALLRNPIGKLRSKFEAGKAADLERMGDVVVDASGTGSGAQVQEQAEAETETETQTVAQAAAATGFALALQNAKPVRDARPSKPFEFREVPEQQFAWGIFGQNKMAIGKKLMGMSPGVLRRGMAVYGRLMELLEPIDWDTIDGANKTLDTLQHAIVYPIRMAATKCRITASELQRPVQEIFREIKRVAPHAANMEAEVPAFFMEMEERMKGTSDKSLKEILFPHGEGESAMDAGDWEICERGLSALAQDEDPPNPLRGTLQLLSQGTAPHEFARTFLLFARMIEGITFPAKLANQFRRAENQLALAEEDSMIDAALTDVAAGGPAGRQPTLDLAELLSKPPLTMLSFILSKLPSNLSALFRMDGIRKALEKFLKILDPSNDLSRMALISAGFTGFVRHIASGGRTNPMQEFMRILVNVKVPGALNSEQKAALCRWAQEELPGAFVAANLLTYEDAQLLGALLAFFIEQFLGPDSSIDEQLTNVLLSFAGLLVPVGNGAQRKPMLDFASTRAFCDQAGKRLQSFLRKMGDINKAVVDAVGVYRVQFEEVRQILAQRSTTPPGAVREAGAAPGQLENEREDLAALETFLREMSTPEGDFDEAKVAAETRTYYDMQNEVRKKLQGIVINPWLRAMDRALARTVFKAAKPLSGLFVCQDDGGIGQRVDQSQFVPLARWVADAADARDGGTGSLRRAQLFGGNVAVSPQFTTPLRAYDSAGELDLSASALLNDPISARARNAVAMLVYDERSEIEIRRGGVPRMRALFLTDREQDGYGEMIRDGYLAHAYLFGADGKRIEGCAAPWEGFSTEQIEGDRSLETERTTHGQVRDAAAATAEEAARQMRIFNGSPTAQDLRIIFSPDRMPSDAVESTISLLQTMMRQKTGEERIDGVRWDDLRLLAQGQPLRAA
jgi:hypothetical protein